jgi:hypothetical protein
MKRNKKVPSQLSDWELMKSDRLFKNNKKKKAQRLCCYIGCDVSVRLKDEKAMTFKH